MHAHRHTCTLSHSHSHSFFANVSNTKVYIVYLSLRLLYHSMGLMFVWKLHFSHFFFHVRTRLYQAFDSRMWYSQSHVCIDTANIGYSNLWRFEISFFLLIIVVQQLKHIQMIMTNALKKSGLHI